MSTEVGNPGGRRNRLDDRRADADADRSYWILEGSQPVGTIALANDALGNRRLRVSSLYVMPGHRARALAKVALATMKRALGRQRLGMRLETTWCWQRTVRFYLGVGFWVRMWKRDLDLFSEDLTPRTAST